MPVTVKLTYTEASPTKKSADSQKCAPALLQPKARITVRKPTTAQPGLRSRQSSVSLNSDGRSSPSPSPTVRIKAKVTSLAKSDSLPARVRATSPPAYPITTASPAANPYRYNPRSPPQPYTYHPFRGTVDPVTVPLPTTHSPPASTLSFSSRSSLSRSNDSPTATSDSDALRATLDNLLRVPSPDPTTTDDESELSVKAEAKSNRKIADLEITNRSLLAINASLESAKNKQAKEIRDLRRKLRESRLILPPRAYRAVQETDPTDPDPDDDDDDASSDDEDDGPEDETYLRVRAILDTLLESGRRALETNPADFASAAPTKVLNPDEVRSWRDADPDDPSELPPADADESFDFDSEDEVQMTLTASSVRASITPSPPPTRILD
ncbi:hypothetical protein H0H92_013106 [Tricholoma furcatifolium]|nr:hypothetical protein H0H92_013106 [Tricholoma furcatifolium]